MAERPGTLRQLLVDLACILCGQADQLTAGNLHELPRLPRRCERCGGSVVATAAQWVVRTDPNYKIDFWAPAAGPPKPGRPRKVKAA